MKEQLDLSLASDDKEFSIEQLRLLKEMIDDAAIENCQPFYIEGEWQANTAGSTDTFEALGIILSAPIIVSLAKLIKVWLVQKRIQKVAERRKMKLRLKKENGNSLELEFSNMTEKDDELLDKILTFLKEK